jgi:hypothetical protein
VLLAPGSGLRQWLPAVLIWQQARAWTRRQCPFSWLCLSAMGKETIQHALGLCRRAPGSCFCGLADEVEVQEAPRRPTGRRAWLAAQAEQQQR